MVRVAVDAMGGDHAPLEVVKGVEAACSEKIAEVVLVGDKGAIAPLLKKPSSIEIVHTPVSVDMDDSPSTAIRRKKASSVNKAFELLREGTVQAVVSAGNSGAAMAFAIFTVGRIPGVERPAILTSHPNAKGGTSVLLDAGGNVDCRPSHLVQFAVMGSAYAEHILGIRTPRVGILSNGQEETKGNELTRETHGILTNLDLNYIGYVEGTELYNGGADVVVADGFVGNVTLKVSEGIAELILLFLKDYADRPEVRERGGHGILAKVLEDLSRRMDYSEYGGVPLVGVDGVAIICHGKSGSRAIKNAIAQAKGLIGKGLNEHIKDAIQHYATPKRSKEL
jgi:glycerol-3-phosphate acyltransferase PlsX